MIFLLFVIRIHGLRSMTFCNLHGEEGRRQRGVWDLKSYEAVLYSNHVLALEASWGLVASSFFLGL